MRRIGLVFLVVPFLAVSMVMAEDLSSLYREFQVLTYEAKTLSVSGRDILYVYQKGDFLRIESKLRGNFYWLRQSPELTWWVDEDLWLDLTKVGDADLETDYRNMLSVEGHKYFTSYNGVFGIGGSDLDYRKDGDPDLWVRGGVGIGRVTVVTPVAQAIAISKELFHAGMLKRELSKETLGKLADLLAKVNAYQVNLKDDWEIRFYEDLADIINAEGAGTISTAAAFKIRQIRVSPVYVISRKSIGWEIAALYENHAMYKGDIGKDKGRLHAYFKYAKPMALNTQLVGSIDCWVPLEPTDTDVYAQLRYTLDHTYTWSSYAGVSLWTTIPEKGDIIHDYKLSVGTGYNIINRLRLNAEAFASGTTIKGENLAVEGRIYFTYYIF